MIITKVNIVGFGHFHNFEMEFQEGLNYITTPNGWGKTTLAAFIKAMFYGLDYTQKQSIKENDRKKYKPWKYDSFGGSLEFEAESKKYRIERFFGEKGKEDTFKLYDLSTGKETEDYSENIGQEIFHVDKEAFTKSVYLEQQDFEVKSNDSLSACLSDSEENEDSLNYEKAIKVLKEEKNRYKRQGNRGLIPELEEKKRKINQELQDLKEKAKEYETLMKTLEEEKNEEKSLIETIKKTEIEIKNFQEKELKAEKKARYNMLAKQIREKETQIAELDEKIQKYNIDNSAFSDEEIEEMNNLIEEEKSMSQELSTLESSLKEDEEKKLNKRFLYITIPAVVFTIVGVAVSVTSQFLNITVQEKYDLLAFGVVTGGVAIILWVLKLIKELIKNRKNKPIDERIEGYKQEISEKEDRINQIKNRIMDVLSVTEYDSNKIQEKLNTMMQNMADSAVVVEKRNTWEAELKELKTQEKEFNDIREMSEDSKQVSEKLQAMETLLKEKTQDRETLIKKISEDESKINFIKTDIDQIPEFERECDKIVESIKEAESIYNRLNLTQEYLTTAKEKFSGNYMVGLKEKFQYYLNLLKNNVESLLDTDLKIKVMGEGQIRDVEFLSAGEKDLVYLAERLAIIDSIYKKEMPVLILDDPFVNLDMDKKDISFGILEKLAGKYQIIYFSCRD